MDGRNPYCPTRHRGRRRKLRSADTTKTFISGGNLIRSRKSEPQSLDPARSREVRPGASAHYGRPGPGAVREPPRRVEGLQNPFWRASERPSRSAAKDRFRSAQPPLPRNGGSSSSCSIPDPAQSSNLAVARKIRCFLGAEINRSHRAYPAQPQRAASPNHAKPSTAGTREGAPMAR